MHLSLAGVLLDLDRALKSRTGAITQEQSLRGAKAAELALPLAAALNIGSEALERARIAYPFFHLLAPELGEVRSALPLRLRGKWDALRSGELIAGEGERCAKWLAAVETAFAVFAGSNGSELPYPSVQVTLNPSDGVLLTCLTEGLALDDALAAGLHGLVTVGRRDGQPGPGDSVLLLGHFDPHGLTMMAATYLHLRALHVSNIIPVCGYTETGDYGKFWKRTLPRLAAGGEFNHAVIVDMTVYARDPMRTISGLGKASLEHVTLHLVDHHLDTLSAVPQMVQAGVEVVLSDIPGCFYGDHITRGILPYSLVGALGDRDSTVRCAYAPYGSRPLPEGVDETLDALSHLMHALSPPPKHLRRVNALPLEQLFAAVEHSFQRFRSTAVKLCSEGYAVPLSESGGRQHCTTAGSAEAAGQVWMRPSCEPLDAAKVAGYDTVQLGRVLLVREALQESGREWYELLEHLLTHHPQADYALTGRFMPDGAFNFLCLRNWTRLEIPPPLAFVPEHERSETLGHYGAFWFNFPVPAVAEERLAAFIQRINRHFGVKGGRVKDNVRRTLLSLVKSRTEGTNHS